MKCPDCLGSGKRLVYPNRPCKECLHGGPKDKDGNHIDACGSCKTQRISCTNVKCKGTGVSECMICDGSGRLWQHKNVDERCSSFPCRTRYHYICTYCEMCDTS